MLEERCWTFSVTQEGHRTRMKNTRVTLWLPNMVKPHDSAEEFPILVSESKSVKVTQKNKREKKKKWLYGLGCCQVLLLEEKSIPVEVEWDRNHLWSSGAVMLQQIAERKRY